MKLNPLGHPMMSVCVGFIHLTEEMIVFADVYCTLLTFCILFVLQPLCQRSPAAALAAMRFQHSAAAQYTDDERPWTGQDGLAQDDPEMWDLLQKEKDRQCRGLELIASEVKHQHTQMREKVSPMLSAPYLYLLVWESDVLFNSNLVLNMICLLSPMTVLVLVMCFVMFRV